MTVIVNPRDFTIRRALPKNHIHITRNFPWDTLEIDWFSVLMKPGNTEVTLPSSVTILLMDKH